MNQLPPREHQVPLVKVHPRVPTLEEVIQVSGNHEFPVSRIKPGALSDQQLSSQDRRPDILSPDYLSVRRGGRIRYIGKAFWGFVSGQVSLIMQSYRSI